MSSRWDSFKQSALNIFRPTKEKITAQMSSENPGLFFNEKGFGAHGASRRRKTTKAWQPTTGDVDTDYHAHLELLRARSRDLVVGGSLPSGIMKKMRTNIVGTGLKPKPTIDAEFLKLTPEAANDLRLQILRLWELWAESTDCDIMGKDNFYELQALALTSQLASGDTFALLPSFKEYGTLFDLRVNLIEADRCNSSWKEHQEAVERGGKVKDGVEFDKNGKIIAYHFSDRHPNVTNFDTPELIRNRVEVSGKSRRNVLHIMETERPGQHRGVPFLSPVIEALKQLERYETAEINKAVIQSFFTVFITSERDEAANDLGVNVAELDEQEQQNYEPNEIVVGTGSVNQLEPGEDVKFGNPASPNSNFDSFVRSVIRQIGTALEIPYELLVNHFESSYSASRAALLEAWKMFKMRRKWLSSKFCQPIYEEWFKEAVIKGYITAPGIYGIFTDQRILKAFTSAEWHGPAQGLLNPVQEVQASLARIEGGLSTREKEAAEQGLDFENVAQQLSREQTILADLQVVTEFLKEANAVKGGEENQNGTDEDESEDNSQE